MNYYNLTTILNTLKETSSTLFNSIYTEDLSEFLQETNKKYLTINFELNNINLQNFDTFNNAILTYNFNVTVGDLTNENNKDSILFAINNSIERSTDLIAKLNQIKDFDIILNRFNPFQEASTDIIAGVTFGLQITVSYALNSCLAAN